MIFTKEQIDEIKRRLAIEGVKDSDIRKLDLRKEALTGEETLVIVKNDENVRVPVKSLLPSTIVESVETVTEDEEVYLKFVFNTVNGEQEVLVPITTIIATYLNDKIEEGISGIREDLNSALETMEDFENSVWDDIDTISNRLDSHESSLVRLGTKATNLENAVSALNRRAASIETTINRNEASTNMALNSIRTDIQRIYNIIDGETGWSDSSSSESSSSSSDSMADDSSTGGDEGGGNIINRQIGE